MNINPFVLKPLDSQRNLISIVHHKFIYYKILHFCEFSYSTSLYYFPNQFCSLFIPQMYYCYFTSKHNKRFTMCNSMRKYTIFFFSEIHISQTVNFLIIQYLIKFIANDLYYQFIKGIRLLTSTPVYTK